MVNEVCASLVNTDGQQLHPEAHVREAYVAQRVPRLLTVGASKKASSAIGVLRHYILLGFTLYGFILRDEKHPLPYVGRGGWCLYFWDDISSLGWRLCFRDGVSSLGWRLYFRGGICGPGVHVKRVSRIASF